MTNDEISDERKQRLFQQWEDLGVDIVRADMATGGWVHIGGPPATRKLALKWLKMKDQEREARVAARYQITVSGENSRVNIGSSDSSTNTVVAGNLITMIKEALTAGVADEAARERLQAALEAIAEAKDKKTFLSHYQAFIAGAADHMTILGPFLPALTALANNLAS